MNWITDARGYKISWTLFQQITKCHFRRDNRKLEVAEINMHIHSQSLRKKILPISKWHPVRLVDKARELRLRGSGHLEAGWGLQSEKDVLTRGERPEQVAMRKDMQVGGLSVDKNRWMGYSFKKNIKIEPLIFVFQTMAKGYEHITTRFLWEGNLAKEILFTQQPIFHPDLTISYADYIYKSRATWLVK